VFFGPLRESVDEKTVRRDAERTVGDLLAGLETDYPDLEGELLDGGDLSPGIAVTVNEDHLQYLDGLATELDDGDVVRLTTAVYGG